MTISALNQAYASQYTTATLPDFSQRQQQQVAQQQSAGVQVTLSSMAAGGAISSDFDSYDMLKKLRSPSIEKLTGLEKMLQGTLDQRLGLDRQTLEQLEQKIEELQKLEPRTDAQQSMLDNLLKEREALIAKTARELNEKEQNSKAEKELPER